MTTDTLQEILNSNINLTETMGVKVLNCSVENTSIWAPLENNRNYLATAFGGSLNALLTITCWSWVLALLDQENIKGEVVIQYNHTEYIKPLSSDFTAQCTDPGTKARQRFLNTLEKKGRARIKLHSHIHDKGQLAVDFFGWFVADKV